ncbi:MAG: hypothetical protein ROO76_04675 [Terriglobia bacterium]|jgi:hypothetical protein|nr:hypothetical protein [Terriglobia bacterium]
MEPSSIVVLVLTLAAVAGLVYAEINSRRNTKTHKQQPGQPEPK